MHMHRINSTDSWNKGAMLLSADWISLHLYWCFLVLLYKLSQCIPVCDGEEVWYTIADGRRRVSWYYWFSRRYLKNECCLMYLFPLSPEQSWLTCHNGCVVVRVQFHSHLKLLVYLVKSASWLCWKVIVGKKESAGVKDSVGRGEQRITTMKRDKMFSFSTILILLEQQEDVLWGYYLQEQQSEINGELFQSTARPVSSCKVWVVQSGHEIGSP